MKIFGELPIGTPFVDNELGETFVKTGIDAGVCGDAASPVCGMVLPFDCSELVSEVPS